MKILRDALMQFTVVGEIRDPETIAAGPGIRVVSRLRQQYGAGRWRRRKGIATVEVKGGAIHQAKVHWYEATGIGKREFKIKRILK